MENSQTFYFTVGDYEGSEYLRAELWAPDGFVGYIEIDEGNREVILRWPDATDNRSTYCSVSEFSQLLDLASKKIISMHPEVFGASHPR